MQLLQSENPVWKMYTVTVTSNYLADIGTTLTLKEKVLSWVTHGHFYMEYGIQKHEIRYV